MVLVVRFDGKKEPSEVWKELKISDSDGTERTKKRRTSDAPISMVGRDGFEPS